MRKTLFAVFLTFVALVGATAQTRLVGRLVSVEQQAIEGATVTLANQGITTTTNDEGKFSLTYLEAWDEEVIVEAYGYVSDILLVQLVENQLTDLGDITLQTDISIEMKEEVVLNLSEMELNDDEGKSQSMASASSASQDVFNATISYAWSNARYRGRGYEQIYEQNYIEGISFNSAERGQFNFSAMGGLNDATRYREVVEGMEASNFTFGSWGKSTNYMQSATNYAQGWKVSLAGTNRNYKGAARATYSTGLMENGWAFTAQLAWRYTPYIDIKGQIGEGISYSSVGYFFTAEKQWGKDKRLSLITFGAPTRRGQSSALTQETYDLTNQYNKTSWGHNNYNPYWGYQDGKVRNSRIVHSYDPTVIASFDWQIDEENFLKAGIGYHYSMYSNSALTFYNATDPRPDYYRNLPSFLWDGQIGNDGKFITHDLNGNPLGSEGYKEGGYLGGWVGASIDLDTYSKIVNQWTNRDDKATQIDWDALYAANNANNVNAPDGSARYIVERRHNDIQEGMINLNYRNTAVDNMTLTAGLEVKASQGIHYKTVDDLLGGNQWIDVDPFAERDIKELATNIGLTQADIANVKQNDLRNPNAAVKDHGRFGYDYRINMINAKLWAQNEWKWNNVDLYYGLQLTYSSIQRTTDMLNGRAWYLAKLNPDNAWYYLSNAAQDVLNATDYSTLPTRLVGTAHHFIDPAVKVGATYKIDGRNQLKVNAMAETKAPLARDAYISPRVHDRAIETIYRHDYAGYYASLYGTSALAEYFGASQKIAGGDLTYSFNYPLVRGRVTGFFTQFWNGTELNGYYDDEARTFVNQSLTGINRRHMGVEAAAAVRLGTYFTLTGVLSVGDYRYTSNALAITSAENGMALADESDRAANDLNQGPIFELRDSVLIKGLRVATGPQVNASLKLSFFHPKMWFADITVNYFDWNFLDYAPARRMQGLFTGVRADGSHVNGSYIDPEINAIAKDEAGNAMYDKYGVPVLNYPYSLHSMQESLVDGNVLNRFLVDVSIGKLIYLPNRQSISINLTVNNLLNNTHFKTGGYQQARLPRQTKQGMTNGKIVSVISPNAWKFPAKYYYAWGTNFYLNIQYKF